MLYKGIGHFFRLSFTLFLIFCTYSEISGVESEDQNCPYCACSQVLQTGDAEVNQHKPLSLREAILRNLLQQPAIKVALYNIDIQRGVAQTSAAPFDPVINSQVFHTYSRDLIDLDQNVNSLNLGQNLVPIGDVPGANPLNMVPVNLTLAQQLAPCSCPSDSSCLNQSQSPNSVAPCPPAVHTHFQAHETTAHVDISKKMREGTRLLFSVDIDQYHNPIFCPKRLNVGRTTLEVDQPLLRDNGYGLDYMTELSNRQEVSAIRYDTLQTISQQVFNTISLYWDTLTQKRLVQAQTESEKRLEEIVEKVKFLIQREQLAPADLMQPLAQLSAQVVSRVQTEQNYFDVQQQLRFAMGEWDETRPCEKKEFALIDDFPTTHINPMALPSIFCHLFPAVFNRRFDILASNIREGVYVLLLKGAKNLELPRLDVVGRVTFTDFKTCSKSEEFFSSFNYTQPQKDITVGVVFSTPFYRDEAKGLIRQRQAQWAQTQAQTQQLKQQALADINAALKDQLNLQQEAQRAKDAVDEYTQLIKNERKKLLAGYSTIFILLNFEASLTNAALTYIQLQGQMAKNIARIRFLTGTLVETSPSIACHQFLVEDVVTLPFNSEENASNHIVEERSCNDK